MSNSGVYVIKNIKNGKPYFGSAENFNIRFSEHKSELCKGCHYNDHLQRAWDKYGSENFKFEPIYYCGEDDLIKYEQKFLDILFNSYKYNDFYNIAKDAKAPMKGRKHSEETKEKMRKDHPKYFEGITGSDHPSWEDNKIRLTCENCNNKYEERKSRKERSNFCSKECQYDYQIGGETHPRTNLTKEDIKKIKKLLKNSDLTQREIGDKFNVSKSSINKIKMGKNWSHVTID